MMIRLVVPVILEHPQVQVSLRTKPSSNEADSLSSDGLVLRFYENHNLTIPIGRFLNYHKIFNQTANDFLNKTVIAMIVS